MRYLIIIFFSYFLSFSIAKSQTDNALLIAPDTIDILKAKVQTDGTKLFFVEPDIQASRAEIQTDNRKLLHAELDAIQLLPGIEGKLQTYGINESGENEKTRESYFYYKQAEELAKFQHYDQAKALFERACKFDPNDNSIVIHNNYGKMLIDWGKPDEAIQQYNKVLSLDPHNEIAQANIAVCFENLADIKQAKFYFKRCIADHPDSYNIGNIKAMLKGLRGAKFRPSDNDNSSPDYVDNLSSFARWTPMLKPIKVYIAPGENIAGFRDSYTKMLIASFDAWTRASNGYLSWTLVPKKKQANIVCLWTNNKNELAHNSSEQGEARVYLTGLGTQYFITQASAILCIVHSLRDDLLDDNEINSMCLHEVGHLMGITGHSPNNNDVMFFVTGHSAAQQLSARDITTLRRIYNY